jgi:hypothetical protein
LCLQAQYYGAPPRQYRFFKRLAEAFVRVGLIDDSRAQGMPSYSYMPGASLSVKETVSGWVNCSQQNRDHLGSFRIHLCNDDDEDEDEDDEDEDTISIVHAACGVCCLVLGCWHTHWWVQCSGQNIN